MADERDIPEHVAKRILKLEKRILPLKQRLRIWFLLPLLLGVAIAVTVYGFVLIHRALQAGAAPDQRLEMLFGAVAMLFPAWLVAKSYLLRRWTTGRWRRTREESLAAVAQCRIRTGKATRPISALQFGYRWSNYNAFEASAPRWKRILGRTALVMYALALLAVAAFGVISVGAAFADSNTAGATVGFLVIAVLVLAWPVIVVRAGLRRRREAGTLRISRAELQDAVDRREAWQESERAKPLGSKINSIFVLACVLTYFWLRNVVYHTGHKQADWITPSLYTFFGIYAVWVQFRKPKRVSATQ